MESLRLMAIHAHPDDETISMGGLLAMAADSGHTTSVVCCTDGKLATIFAEDMPEEEYRPKLAAVRQEELRRACSILGVSEVVFLEYGDSGMEGADTNTAPGAFWRADLNEVIGRLVGEIRRFRPHVVVTYDAFGGYGHPDHIQTHRAAVLAVEAAHTALYPDAGERWQVSKLYYTALPRSEMRRVAAMAAEAGMEFPFDVDGEAARMLVDDDWVTTTVHCGSAIARKRAAMRAHHSQINEDFPLLRVPEEVQVEQFPNEYFHLATSRVAVTVPETDVFSGLDRASEVAGV